MFRLQTDNTRNKQTNKNKNIKHKKQPFNQLNFKEHQNCRENSVFHRLKAKQETRQKTEQENYQKQNQHRKRKAETYTMKTKTKNNNRKRTSKK